MVEGAALLSPPWWEIYDYLYIVYHDIRAIIRFFLNFLVLHWLYSAELFFLFFLLHEVNRCLGNAIQAPEPDRIDIN